MLDARPISLMATMAEPLPVATMVLGKAPETVAELMPRVFNLCRAAQEAAVRLALGLPGAVDADALRRDIIRDHVLRLSVVLPGHLSEGPVPLPRGWQGEAGLLRDALFGGRLPQTMAQFRHYLSGDAPVARLWARVLEVFSQGEAVADALPFVSDMTACDPLATVENSCAVRVGAHPLLRALKAQYGRGPLWRVVAQCLDLEALLDGGPVVAVTPEPGLAHVQAARGLYTVIAKAEAGRVTGFTRITPTDHLCAPGGVLAQSLARLPVERALLAPLVVDILNPCVPVQVREAGDA